MWARTYRHTHTHATCLHLKEHINIYTHTHTSTYVYPHLIYTDQQRRRPGKDVCEKEEEFSVKGFSVMYLYLMGSPHTQDKRL